jgi:hypothetical protein
VTSLLDELKASDPILLLAIADCPFKELSREIKSWFGVSRSSKVLLSSPDEAQRTEFFADTIANIRRPPTDFPGALPRKKRVLEVLPKAPPREPRKPTESELQSQLAQDQKLVEYLKFRLGPVLNELKKKHKRFTKPINVGLGFLPLFLLYLWSAWIDRGLAHGKLIEYFELCYCSLHPHHYNPKQMMMKSQQHPSTMTSI